MPNSLRPNYRKIRRFLKFAKVILSLVFLALKILKQILDFWK